MRPINSIGDEKFLRILLEVKEQVVRIFGKKLRHLILFGSYARNEQDPESDIDLMVLAEESEEELRANRYVLGNVMADLSIKHDKLISVMQVPYKRYKKYLDVLPFYQNVTDEGIEIYGRQYS